jgi:hypothetical protein
MGPITQKGLSPFFGTHDSLELIFSELLSIIVASHIGSRAILIATRRRR